ncbi:MAG: DUF1622 domain-containing protein [Leptolyngbyaceae cyanobacterium MO_188.B28]|nr:DUF1622 domain-containing protein [Leptolyngbyaceae cyanobacterium MO_188.B28]
MEFIEHLEAQLAVFIALLKLALEAVAALCVLIGLVKTVQLAIVLNLRRSRKIALVLLRLRFGVWLAIALEFQLGADIVATTLAPTFEALGKLGAIAAIRTFLNYFLNKELAREIKSNRKTEQKIFNGDGAVD